MESYETQIQRSIDYIEEDVMEKQTLRNLACIAGFSESHFHRVFQALVGDTVMEYVRKRRLARQLINFLIRMKKLLILHLNMAFNLTKRSREPLKNYFK